MLYYSHQTVTVSAFGSYMLSRSGCFTELSTEEVIMNSKVYAAADSDDPTMQLRMIGQHHNAESELFDANVLYGVCVISETLEPMPIRCSGKMWSYQKFD